MIAIRRYQQSDHAALMCFLADVLATMGRQFLPDSKDADIREVDAVYLSGRGAFFVAEVDGIIRGSAGVRHFSNDVAELKRVYVHHSFRGQRLGLSLCQAAIDAAKSLNYSAVRLDTTTESLKALALFDALGFKNIGRYNTDPFADIFMQLDL